MVFPHLTWSKVRCGTVEYLKQLCNKVECYAGRAFSDDLVEMVCATVLLAQFAGVAFGGYAICKDIREDILHLDVPVEISTSKDASIDALLDEGE